jgi:putative transposase
LVRTVRDQFLVEIDDGVDLAELNRLFSAWFEVVYHGWCMPDGADTA